LNKEKNIPKDSDKVSKDESRKEFFRRSMTFSITVSSIVAAILISLYGSINGKQNFYTKLSVVAFTISFLLSMEHYMYYNSYLTTHKKLHLKIGQHCHIGEYLAMILGLLFLFKGYKQNYAYIVMLGYAIVYVFEKIIDYVHYIRDNASIKIKNHEDYVRYLKDNPSKIIIPSFTLSLTTVGIIETILHLPAKALFYLAAIVSFMIIYGALIIYYIKILHPIFQKAQKTFERFL